MVELWSLFASRAAPYFAATNADELVFTQRGFASFIWSPCRSLQLLNQCSMGGDTSTQRSFSTSGRRRRRSSPSSSATRVVSNIEALREVLAHWRRGGQTRSLRNAPGSCVDASNQPWWLLSQATASTSSFARGFASSPRAIALRSDKTVSLGVLAHWRRAVASETQGKVLGPCVASSNWPW